MGFQTMDVQPVAKTDSQERTQTMICNPEDIVKILEAIDKRGFSEAQVIALKEVIRQTIQEMDGQGYWNHDHKDGEQEPYNEER